MFSGDIELNLVRYFCNSVQNNSPTKLISSVVLEQRLIRCLYQLKSLYTIWFYTLELINKMFTNILTSFLTSFLTKMFLLDNFVRTTATCKTILPKFISMENNLTGTTIIYYMDGSDPLMAHNV